MLTSLTTVTAFFPIGQWQNSGAVKLTCFEPSGFGLCAQMVVIFHASSLMDVNKCVINLSQCDTEVLPLNSWKSEGMFTLCSGAKSRIRETTGDLGWKVHMVKSSAGSPARFPSILAAVPQISAGGRSPAEHLLPLVQCQNAAILLLDTDLSPAASCLSHIRCPSSDEEMQADPCWLPGCLT